MKSYRIVLEYTENTQMDGIEYHRPETWDWRTLLDIRVDEAISVVSVEEIETPAAHVEDIMQDGLGQDALDELAEISQQHNMGYPNEDK